MTNFVGAGAWQPRAIVLFVCVSSSLCASAQAPATLPLAEVPRLSMVPALSADPNDRAWNEALRIDNLKPADGTPAGTRLQPTNLLLGWAPDALYVRFMCRADSVYNPSKGTAGPLYAADSVEVFLDPKGDSRQWIELVVSPENAVLTVLHLCTTTPVSDAQGELLKPILRYDTWDFSGWKGLPHLKTAAGRWPGAGEGWIVDMAIPPEILHRLGVDRFAAMTLRANFVRNDYPPHAGDSPHPLPFQSEWSPTLMGQPHRSPERMGYLRLEESAVSHN